MPLGRLRFRNGVVIESPPKGQLEFLLHEIWVDRVYTPPGYGIAAGEVVVDVGANLGTFALFAATRAAGVRVYAYEPSPEVCDYLRRNVKMSHLDNIEVVQAAVAGAAGERPFTDGVTRLSGALAKPGSAGVSVRCWRLDDVFRLHRLEHCDLLKLDCEGAEYEILEHTPPETLAKVRRIVGEYHVGETGDAARLRSLLEQRGWRIDVLKALGPECGTFCATNPGFSAVRNGT